MVSLTQSLPFGAYVGCVIPRGKPVERMGDDSASGIHIAVLFQVVVSDRRSAARGAPKLDSEVPPTRLDPRGATGPASRSLSSRSTAPRYSSGNSKAVPTQSTLWPLFFELADCRPNRQWRARPRESLRISRHQETYQRAARRGSVASCPWPFSFPLRHLRSGCRPPLLWPSEGRYILGPLRRENLLRRRILRLHVLGALARHKTGAPALRFPPTVSSNVPSWLIFGPQLIRRARD